MEAKVSYSFPSVGETLYNGGEVKAVIPDRRRLHCAYILCRFQGKYVTWVYNAQVKGVGNGHYFDSIDAAWNDLLSLARSANVQHPF